MKTFLLLCFCCVVGVVRAQTAPAADSKDGTRPRLGLNQPATRRTYVRPANRKPSFVKPQSDGAVAAGSYQTRPHSMRVVVPDTSGQKMARKKMPTASDSKGIMPLPPQRKE